MQAQFLVWAKSRYHDGNRDTADTVVSIPCAGAPRNLTAIARHLDGEEQESVARSLGWASANGERLASFHGVTIVYASGRMRTVRAA